MERLYLGMWDNYGALEEGRLIGVQEVTSAVRDHGEVEVSFDYNGRSRHMQAAEAMAEMLPEDFKVSIGYNYHFTVSK